MSAAFFPGRSFGRGDQTAPRLLRVSLISGVFQQAKAGEFKFPKKTTASREPAFFAVRAIGAITEGSRVFSASVRRAMCLLYILSIFILNREVCSLFTCFTYAASHWPLDHEKNYESFYRTIRCCCQHFSLEISFKKDSPRIQSDFPANHLQSMAPHQYYPLP